MKGKPSILNFTVTALALCFMLSGAAWAQDACAGALIPPIEGPGIDAAVPRALAHHRSDSSKRGRRCDCFFRDDTE